MRIDTFDTKSHKIVEEKILKNHHCFADDNIDWIAENCTPIAAGAGGTENRSIFGVWCGRAGAADGHVRIDRALAGVHLVKNS